MTTKPDHNENSIATPVVVSLTVDHMRHQILQYLADYEGHIQQGVRESVALAFEKFNFGREVGDQVAAMIREAVLHQVRREIDHRVEDYLGEYLAEIETKVDRVMAALRPKGDYIP